MTLDNSQKVSRFDIMIMSIKISFRFEETKELSENDRALKKRQGAEEKRQGAAPCRLGLARTLMSGQIRGCGRALACWLSSFEILATAKKRTGQLSVDSQ